MTQTLVLVIGPLDNRDAVAKVTAALRKQPGLVVVEDSELAAGVERRRQWKSRWKEALSGTLPGKKPLESPRVSVVVVPRLDGTIGAGSRADIHQAQEAKVSVKIVRRDGVLVPLEEAGLELVSRRPIKGSKSAPASPEAISEYRKVAARFFAQETLGAVD